MAANPVFVGGLKYEERARKFNILCGSTALVKGSLCKISSGALVPLAADDENLEVFVALERADANAARVTACFFADVLVAVTYTAAPTVGLAYGVDGPLILDQSNTTQKLATVVEVDTSKELAWVAAYQILS